MNQNKSDDEKYWQETIKNVKKISSKKIIQESPKKIIEIRNSINLTHVYSGNKLSDISIDNHTEPKHP